MNSYRVAMIQMFVEASRLDKNLELASVMVKEAKRRGCDMVVLPECFDLGWSNPQARELSHPIPGHTSDYLCNLAKTEGVYIITGITEKADDNIYNAALLISSEGNILSKYRKINILPDVESVYSVGNMLSVHETPFGTIGINICADNLEGSTNIAHTLARMGAEVIFSPCSWAVPPTFDNTKTPYGNEWLQPYNQLSTLYDIYILGVSNVGPVTVGPWKGWNCIGNSIAMGPGGNVITILQHGAYANQIEIVEIQPIKRTVIGTDIKITLANKGYTMN